MIKGYFSKTPAGAKFFLSLGIVIITFLIITLIGFAICMLVFKIDIYQTSTLFSNLSNPQTVTILKFLQMVQSIALFVVPPFIAAFLFYKSAPEYLYINKKPGIMPSVGAILIMIAAIPIINFLANLNSNLALPDFLSGLEASMKSAEIKAMEITQAFLNITTTQQLILNIFVIAVIPALGEEFLFRGIFQRLFIEWTKNVHVGILVSAVLFSAFHLQFYGFLPRMMMGIFFGYLLVWSGSIWVPVMAHFINNAFAVVVSYLVTKNTININIESLGISGDGWIFVLMSAITVAGFSAGIYLHCKRQSVASTPCLPDRQALSHRK
ncbi:MAG TPA: hypothetical protein DEH02_15260 [Bacteroidales bacterium]|nr:hypothetical protein [Bacteroidales bacterium]